MKVLIGIEKNQICKEKHYDANAKSSAINWILTQTQEVHFQYLQEDNSPLRDSIRHVQQTKPNMYSSIAGNVDLLLSRTTRFYLIIHNVFLAVLTLLGASYMILMFYLWPCWSEG
jgi:hypothetical protein